MPVRSEGSGGPRACQTYGRPEPERWNSSRLGTKGATIINPDESEPILRLIGPDERLHVVATASQHRILVTDRRVAVAEEGRIVLNIPIGNLRRIEFDIEKSRPATLILVPERPSDAPQVFTMPVEHYAHVAKLLAVLGEFLAKG